MSNKERDNGFKKQLEVEIKVKVEVKPALLRSKGGYKVELWKTNACAGMSGCCF